MGRRANYSRRHATAADLTPGDIGAHSWEDVEGLKRWQAAQGLHPDGWFGPKGVRAWRKLQCGSSADSIKVFDDWVTVPGIASVEYRPGVLASRTRRTGRTVNSIVLHQSVTYSREATERVLQKRGLGVCSLIDGDGSLTVYGDIGMRQHAHANERNGSCIGVEIVNPYYPLHDGAAWGAPKLPWTQVVSNRTAHRGREICDTEAQLQTAAAWLLFLTSLEVDGPGRRAIEIPRSFPTTGASTSRGHDDWFDLDIGGVLAHGHRPGRYPAGHSKAGKRTRSHADARRTAVELKTRLGW